jgi:DNA-binding transcriptional ArsR family regulator
MSKAASPSQDEATVDVKLMKALGHPVRQRILQELTRSEEASPSQIAQAIEEPLTNVGYHARVLVKCDAIELVRTEVSGSSVEHFYRAKVRAVVDEDNWRNIPENVRESLLDQTMQQIWSNVRSASSDDALKDLNTTVVWDALELDEEGFAELSRAIGDLLDHAKAVQASAQMRLEGMAPDEREERSRLVELDAMLYPVREIPTPRRVSRHSHSGSESTGSNST